MQILKQKFFWNKKNFFGTNLEQIWNKFFSHKCDIPLQVVELFVNFILQAQSLLGGNLGQTG